MNAIATGLNIIGSRNKSLKNAFARISLFNTTASVRPRPYCIGTPIIKGAKVEANLIKNSKNRTVLVFKKRRRKNSRRKNGHRQQYSLIRINKIFSKDGKLLSEAEKISKPDKSKKEVKKETQEKK